MPAPVGETVTAEGIGGEAALRLFADGSRPPASRSTTRASCRSSRPRRPRPPCCSTSSSARRRSTPGRGSRAPARCTPRTRRCAGWPTWPGCRPRPAACSCRAARSATCRRSSRRAHAARSAGGGRPPRPLKVAATDEAHSSVGRARDVMDAELVGVPVDDARPADRRRRCADALAADGRDGVFAVVATAGTTNFGIVDDLAGIADGLPRARPLVARRRGLRRRRRWPRRRVRARSSPASSAPTRSSSTRTSGCSRRSTAARCSTASPELARAAHTQHAGLPRRPHARRRVEPVRLRHPPHPPRARPAVLVLARHQRHRAYTDGDRAAR